MNRKAEPTRRSVLALSVSLLALVSVSFAPAIALAAPKIVVLGDSLSAGYQLPPGAAFPEKLQKALDAKGVAAEIVGAGVSGDTLAGGLSRLDWSVGDDADAVIVELGGNDALRGLPVEKARSSLETIITRLKERGKLVLLAGMMAPPNMGDAYVTEFNAMYGKLARKHDVMLYPFFLEGVAAVPELNLADGFHPNEKGIDVIVERILPDVKKLVAEAEEKGDS
ncbi:arylesterase [Pseudahrensia aquimaris]|uniref:Arylesterase n=1 Tax=Pseudahrensia aquimaris TaxID=744461 RepID=A0ABW3FDW9_9HYPH